MLLQGKSTGQGGISDAFALSGTVKVSRFNTSKTGNHWSIRVEGSGDLLVKEISNSGKHYCFSTCLEDGTEIGERKYCQHDFDGSECICSQYKIGENKDVSVKGL